MSQVSPEDWEASKLLLAVGRPMSGPVGWRAPAVLNLPTSQERNAPVQDTVISGPGLVPESRSRPSPAMRMSFNDGEDRGRSIHRHGSRRPRSGQQQNLHNPYPIRHPSDVSASPSRGSPDFPRSRHETPAHSVDGSRSRAPSHQRFMESIGREAHSDIGFRSQNTAQNTYQRGTMSETHPRAEHRLASSYVTHTARPLLNPQRYDGVSSDILQGYQQAPEATTSTYVQPAVAGYYVDAPPSRRLPSEATTMTYVQSAMTGYHVRAPPPRHLPSFVYQGTLGSIEQLDNTSVYHGRCIPHSGWGTQTQGVAFEGHPMATSHNNDSPPASNSAQLSANNGLAPDVQMLDVRGDPRQSSNQNELRDPPFSLNNIDAVPYNSHSLNPDRYDMYHHPQVVDQDQTNSAPTPSAVDSYQQLPQFVNEGKYFTTANSSNAAIYSARMSGAVDAYQKLLAESHAESDPRIALVKAGSKNVAFKLFKSDGQGIYAASHLQNGPGLHPNRNYDLTMFKDGNIKPFAEAQQEAYDYSLAILKAGANKDMVDTTKGRASYDEMRPHIPDSITELHNNVCRILYENLGTFFPEMMYPSDCEPGYWQEIRFRVDISKKLQGDGDKQNFLHILVPGEPPRYFQNPGFESFIKACLFDSADSLGIRFPSLFRRLTPYSIAFFGIMFCYEFAQAVKNLIRTELFEISRSMPTFLIMLETLHELFKVDQGLIAFAERVPTDGRLEYEAREQCKANAAAAKVKAENDAREAQRQAEAQTKAATKFTKAANTAAAKAARAVERAADRAAGRTAAAIRNQSNPSTMGTSTPAWQSSLHGAVDYNPPS